MNRGTPGVPILGTKFNSIAREFSCPYASKIVRFTPIDMRSCRYASAAIAVSSRADRSAPSMPTELREFISNETHSHAPKLCGCVRRCKVARSLWPSSRTNRSYRVFSGLQLLKLTLERICTYWDDEASCDASAGTSTQRVVAEQCSLA